jgi:predicted NAD/FAD-binding protein
MKIAVIGGGIAGLAAAFLLSRRHAVTLFERQAQPGLIAASVAVQALGTSHRVDVPLRVFYRGYYPQLTRLYAELGVATEPVDYATTFTGADARSYFRYRNLHLGSRAYAYLLPQDLAGARARRIVQAALHFHRLARAAGARGELAGRSIGEFVSACGVGPEFVDGVLLPAIATVGTCTLDDARAYPATVVAGYMTGGLHRESVRRACQGADFVAAQLLAGIARVHCNADVQALRRDPRGDAGPDGPAGVWLARGGQDEERFDHIVLATQANHARRLWTDASPAEAEVLDAFRYRALEVVMHRDSALMPARRADWSPVNARVCATQERPESTIWINRVQPALRHAPPLFQTVQPQRQPRDELVIARARFERPLVDAASQRAVAALQRLHAQPGRRLWLCGSYAQPGVPLLESAVCSAYAVAAALQSAATATGSADQGRVAAMSA